MKCIPILSLAMLAAIVATTPSALAKEKMKGSAVVQSQSFRGQTRVTGSARQISPSVTMQTGAQRATSSARFQTVPTRSSAMIARTSSPRIQSTGTRFENRSVTQSPTVAFGGRTRSNVTTRDFSTRDFRPPFDTYRGWSRDRIYSWNHHRYHWYGGEWVILDTDLYEESPSIVTYETTSGGSLVAQVQEKLANRGYNPGPVDGVIGGKTRNAIEEYQNDHDLAVTGRIDTPLIRSLNL